MNTTVHTRGFGAQVSRNQTALVQALFVLTLIFTIFSSQKVFSQATPIADYFDYPMGDRGYDTLANQIDTIWEYINPETNNFYSIDPDLDSIVATPQRGPYILVNGKWYNASDVGDHATNGIRGGIHPGGDWNLYVDGVLKPTRGQNLYAVANGIVDTIRKAGKESTVDSAGWAIILKHYLADGDSMYSFYVHTTTASADSLGTVCFNLSDFTISVGDVVTRGQLIAKVGNVKSYTPHLHFEMRTHFNKTGLLWPHGTGGRYPANNAMYAVSMTEAQVQYAYDRMRLDSIIDGDDYIDAHRQPNVIDPEPECGGPEITSQNTIGGSADEYTVAINSTADGGYIMASGSASGISGDKTEALIGSDDYWIVKLDANSNIEWQKTYGGTEADEPFVIKQTTDGGYIVGGNSMSGISGSKSETNRGSTDYWILKLNATGTIEWQKTVGGSFNEYLHDIVISNDGYVIVGSSSSGASGDKTETSFGSDDCWIVKLDLTGAILWQKVLGGSGAEEASSGIETPTGSYLFAFGSTSDVSGNKTESAKGGTDYWLVELSADGTTILWQDAIGGSSYDTPTDIVSTSDGGYIVLGYSGSGVSADKTEPSNGSGDYWVLKFDSEGNVEWQNTIGGSDMDMSSNIIETPTGYAITGMSLSNQSGDKCEDSHGSYDVWVVVLDTVGNILQENTLGGSGSEDLSVPLAFSPDGGVVFAVRTNSAISGDKTEANNGARDIWIVKLGGDTIPEECDDYGIAQQIDVGGTAEDMVTCIDQTPDGGVIVGGYSFSGISAYKDEPSFGIADYWVVKLDAAGDTVWENTIGGAGGDYLYSVQQTLDGGYILGGMSDSGISGDKTQASKGGFDYWVVKISPDGETIEWQKTIGGSLADRLKTILTTSDGGYVLGGYSSSGISGDKSQANQGGTDYWIVKIDNDGDIVWQNTIGGASNDDFVSMIESSDGSYVLLGSSQSGISGNKTQISEGSQDYWLVKISSVGVIVDQETVGGSSTDIATTIEQTEDSGFLLAGWSSSGISGDKNEVNMGGYDYWIVKLSNDFNTVEFQKTSGTNLNNFPYYVHETADGGYVIGGQTTDPTTTLGDYHFVKFTSSNVFEWEEIVGGTGDEHLATVVKTDEGKYIFAGSSKSGISGVKNQPTIGDFDYWIVGLECGGCTPTTEICNSIDDDCDGLVDDGIVVTVSIENFGASTFCQGGSAALGATPTPGTTLQWYKNAVAIAGATSTTYNATATGVYTCQATNACASATSNSVTITVNKNPTASIAAGGATEFCAGGSVTLTVTASAGTTKQWYKGATAIAGATGTTYVATTTGNYKCKVTKTATGCVKNSNTIAVTVVCREGEVVETSVKVYPNPTSGLFTVDIEDATSVSIVVMNMLGQVVAEQFATDDCTIDLTGSPRGSYMVSVVSSASVHSEIIVLE